MTPTTFVRAALGLLLLSVTACTSVPPGYVGIKINQYGSQKGVSDFPLQTGAVWYFPPTTDVVTFPVFTQRVIYDKVEGEPDESITFRSKDSATLNVDVGMTFSLIRDKVPNVYVSFRQDLQSLERGIIRDRLRGAFGRHAPMQTTMELLGSGQTALEVAVTEDLRKELEPHGIHIDTVQIVNKPRIDPQVEQSITNLLTQLQNTRTAEQKVKQIEAEAQQRVAAAEGARKSSLIEADAAAQTRLMSAEADAKSNKLLNESMNDRLLQLEAMKRWNGVLPTMMSGQVPFIKVN